MLGRQYLTVVAPLATSCPPATGLHKATDGLDTHRHSAFLAVLGVAKEVIESRGQRIPLLLVRTLTTYFRGNWAICVDCSSRPRATLPEQR